MLHVFDLTIWPSGLEISVLTSVTNYQLFNNNRLHILSVKDLGFHASSHLIVITTTLILLLRMRKPRLRKITFPKVTHLGSTRAVIRTQV